MNRRFVAYAAAHGLSPDEMLAHDEARYPGGCMTGFIVWVSARWREWKELHGFDPRGFVDRRQHARFDAWLAERVAA